MFTPVNFQNRLKNVGQNSKTERGRFASIILRPPSEALLFCCKLASLLAHLWCAYAIPLCPSVGDCVHCGDCVDQNYPKV